MNFDEYNKILAYYQAIACIENSRGSSVLDLPCRDGTLTAISKKDIKTAGFKTIKIGGIFYKMLSTPQTD